MTNPIFYTIGVVFLLCSYIVIGYFVNKKINNRRFKTITYLTDRLLGKVQNDVAR